VELACDRMTTTIVASSLVTVRFSRAGEEPLGPSPSTKPRDPRSPGLRCSAGGVCQVPTVRVTPGPAKKKPASVKGHQYARVCMAQA
jgi:hypothetical protein